MFSKVRSERPQRNNYKQVTIGMMEIINVVGVNACSCLSVVSGHEVLVERQRARLQQRHFSEAPTANINLIGQLPMLVDYLKIVYRSQRSLGLITNRYMT